jgi:hypothetical protein
MTGMLWLIRVGRQVIRLALRRVMAFLGLVLGLSFPFGIQMHELLLFGFIDPLQHLAMFLAELNLEIPLLKIRMLLLDLLDPFSERRLHNTFMTINGPDHGDTFGNPSFRNYSIGEVF